MKSAISVQQKCRLARAADSWRFLAGERSRLPFGARPTALLAEQERAAVCGSLLVVVPGGGLDEAVGVVRDPGDGEAARIA
jgi:hypothetical protein